MSMNKEDLMADLKICSPVCEMGSEHWGGWEAVASVMLLRQVIALVEIRESIDQLRGSINDLGNQLEIRDTLGAKDIRSAGIG
jgi:hypothetical protein